MAAVDHEHMDRVFREHFAQGDLEQTATAFMQRYGQEIVAFLTDRLRDSGLASEVFSQFAEDFWRGLPRFGWRSSLRAWAYALARNAAHRHFRSLVHRTPHATFTEDGRYGMEVARLRTATGLHLRTEVKSRMRMLRERLSDDEQVLLILRVDRSLSWKELALVMSGESELASAEVDRLAANLRQRFQQVKRRLRQLAKEDGLLEDSDA